MMTSTIGLRQGCVLLALLLAACGGSVEQELGGGGNGGEAELGGADGEGAHPPLGGGGDEGGADEGGAGQGGAEQGGAGQGGAPSEACALMALTTIADPELIDAGGDLVWSPGESATFRVTLTNEASADNMNYPGVEASSEERGIEPGSNTLFGIFAGESTPVEVTVVADDELASGTGVEVVFTVTTLSEGCGALDSVSLSVTLD